MKHYPIEIIDNHIITVIDGYRVLIDTGSPYSMGGCKDFHFLGRDFQLQNNYMGLGVSKLSTYIGTKIDVLLGMDILSNTHLTIDYQSKSIQVSLSPLEFTGNIIPLSFVMGIPIIEIYINGSELKVFVDTGAKLSYLTSEITESYQKMGTTKDFYPMYGEFETPLYEVPITISGSTVNITTGNLPTILQLPMQMLGVDGIIGNDIFKYYKVYYDFPDSRMVIQGV